MIPPVFRLYALALSLWGCVVIYGTYRRWRFLVDPPDNHWWWYLIYGGMARMRRTHGEKRVVLMVYLIGAWLVIFGIGIQFVPG